MQVLFWDNIETKLFGTKTTFISVYENKKGRYSYIINIHTKEKPNVSLGDTMKVFSLPYYHLIYQFEDCSINLIRKKGCIYETKIYSQNMDFRLSYKVEFKDVTRHILAKDYNLVYNQYGNPENMTYNEFKEKLMAVKL